MTVYRRGKLGKTRQRKWLRSIGKSDHMVRIYAGTFVDCVVKGVPLHASHLLLILKRIKEASLVPSILVTLMTLRPRNDCLFCGAPERATNLLVALSVLRVTES